jgi:hypothetical protein
VTAPVPADLGAYRLRRALVRLAASYPGWLITCDEQAGLFSARRPGLRITRRSAPALDAELAGWESTPGEDS